MSEGAKVRARRGSMELEGESAPRKPSTTGDKLAAAAIEQLLGESSDQMGAQPPTAAERRAPRPVSDHTAGDLEALFAAAIDEVASPDSALSDAESYIQGEASDDDSPGFDGGVEENTQVDAEPTDDDPKTSESIAEGTDDAFTEGLRELDFYLTRTLIDEAQSLLDTLQERYHDHPELTRRAETLARLT